MMEGEQKRPPARPLIKMLPSGGPSANCEREIVPPPSGCLAFNLRRLKGCSNYPRQSSSNSVERRGNDGRFILLEYYEHLREENVKARKRLRDRLSAGKEVIPSDEDFMQMMFRQYGEMDVTNPLTLKIFETFKKTYLGMIKEEEEDLASSRYQSEKREDRLSSLFHKYGKQQNKSVVLDDDLKRKMERIEGKLNQRKKFNKRESIYQSLDPWVSYVKADWIRVPRPYEEWGRRWLLIVQKMLAELIGVKRRRNGTLLRKGARMVMVKDIESMYASMLKDRIEPNLAIFDPKYFIFPRYVFNKVPSKTEDLPSSALCEQLHKLIHKPPHGMTLTALQNLFRTKGWYDSGESDGPNVPEETRFPYVEEVFCYLKGENPDGFGGIIAERELLLPEAFESLSLNNKHVFDIRMSHYLLLAFGFSNKEFAPLPDVLESMKNSFGINVFPEKMGFSGKQDFLARCFNNSPHVYVDYLYVRNSDNKRKDSGSRKQYYLIRTGSKTQFDLYRWGIEERFYTNIRGISSYLTEVSNGAPRPGPREIKNFPEGYMSPFDKIHVEAAEKVEAGWSYVAYCYWAFSPSKFYIMLKKDIESAEVFMQTLQKRAPKFYKPKAHEVPHLLGVGQHIVFKRERYDGSEEWNKAQIVALLRKPTAIKGDIKFKVRSTDYGEEVSVPLENIRLLPTTCGTYKFGIPCFLTFDDQLLERKARRDDWSSSDRNLFTPLIAAKPVKVTFVEKWDTLQNDDPRSTVQQEIRRLERRLVAGTVKILPERVKWGVKIEELEESDLPELSEDFQHIFKKFYSDMKEDNVWREVTYSGEYLEEPLRGRKLPIDIYEDDSIDSYDD